MRFSLELKKHNMKKALLRALRLARAHYASRDRGRGFTAERARKGAREFKMGVGLNPTGDVQAPPPWLDGRATWCNA